MTPRYGWRRWCLKLAAIAAFLLLAAAVPVRAVEPGCTPEPASIWAPAGWKCPPLYGAGTASVWGGPGAATNSCTHAIRDTVGCPAITIRSLTTGIVIQTVPIEWCMCWVGVTGPNGETERIVDLDPVMVRALGLDPARGLFAVTVEPVGEQGATMSDTAVAL